MSILSRNNGALLAVVLLAVMLNLSLSLAKEEYAPPKVAARSFKALNKALEKAVKGHDNPDDHGLNLQLVLDLGEEGDKKTCLLSQTTLKPAAKAVELISQSSECTQDVLDRLRFIAAGAHPASGTRRIDKLVKHYVEPFKQSCGETLDFEHKISTWQLQPKRIGKLLDHFEESSKYFFSDENPQELEAYLASPLGVHHATDDKMIESILRDVQVLSEGDKTVAFEQYGQSYDDITGRLEPSHIVIHRSASLYRKAFVKYVRKPCEHHNSLYYYVYDATFALKALYGQSDEEFFKSFIEPRSEEFKNSLLAYKRCNAILGLSRFAFEKNMRKSFNNPN